MREMLIHEPPSTHHLPEINTSKISPLLTGEPCTSPFVTPKFELLEQLGEKKITNKCIECLGS